MSIKKYFADSDNTITNAFRENLQTRGTGANMGASSILEVFSIYGQAFSSSTELERILIKFPVSEIINDRTNNLIPSSGSISFFLTMYNARHNQTTPRNSTLVVAPISQSWQEGTGLDMEEYRDVTQNGLGSNWVNAGKADPWTRQGGDYLASPNYSQNFPIGNEDLKINITGLVEKWISGTITNYGVGVHLTSSQEAYYADFFPREAVQFDKAAYLSGSATMSPTESSSISLWIYPTDSSATGYLMFWQSPSSISFQRVLYEKADKTLAYIRKYAAGATRIDSVDTIPDNQWTHISVTHEQSNPSALPTMYINGVSSSVSGTTTGAGLAVPFDMIAIGGSNAGSSNNFSGSLDDIAYFDKVLSAPEVTEIYNSGCPSDLKTASSFANLKNWWVNGDDPKDSINLGTPPTEISIYDRIGTIDMYATGTGGMKIIDSVCSGQNGVVPVPANGQIINTNGAKDTYYTKKFFGKGTGLFFKLPAIEAVWDSSKKDDRGNFYASSSLVPGPLNIRTLFLYNVIGGRLVNIPEIGTGDLRVQLYTSASGGDQIGATVVGGYSSKGIYTASFSMDTSASVAYDRWYNPPLTDLYNVAKFNIKQYAASNFNPYPNLVTNLTNLRANYSTRETARFRFYVREKDWSPTIYTVATSRNDTQIIESASYQIYRVTDDLIVIPYNTGSDKGTEMSFDVSGNYFDLKMDFLEPGYSYGINVAYYDETVNSYVEQPHDWKFRVEKV